MGSNLSANNNSKSVKNPNGKNSTSNCEKLKLFKNFEFNEFCDSANDKFLNSTVIPLAIGVASYLNYSFFSSVSEFVYFSYLPAFLVWFLYRILKLFNSPNTMKATFWSIAFGICTVFGVTVVVINGGQVTLINASHQIILLGISLLVRCYNVRIGFIYFFTLLFFTYGSIYFYSPNLISLTIMQPLLLGTLGYFLVKIRHKELEFSFFEKKMKIHEAILLSEELKKVVYPHQLEQVLSGRKIEQTLPIGINVACSLKFDVVDSGEIVHENFKKTLRKVDNRCKTILMEGYESESLVSTGFRLKGTGDGFISTHGFPFKTFSGVTSSSVAFDCALRFLYIFDEEMRVLDYPKTILCSIGIALGDIEGYFSEVGSGAGEKGIIEYDMSGRGLDLSDRYETVRKQIFTKNKQINHLISIPEKVFKNLTRKQRTGFEEILLAEKGFTIRGDRSARYVYMKQVKPKQDMNKLNIAA